MDKDFDLRIQKTKAKLKDSLIVLLVKYDFDHISVSQICEKANITRATFYKYYKDKFELVDDAVCDLGSGLDSLYDTIFSLSSMNPEEKSKAYIKEVLQESLKFRKILLGIINKEGNALVTFIIRMRIQEYLDKSIRRYYKYDPKDYPPNILGAFFEGGITRSIMEWLEKPNNFDIDSMVNLIYHLVDKLFKKEVIFHD